MFDIILSNFGLWFNFLIPVVICGYLALTHREYIWSEFGIQVGATFTYLVIVYFIAFNATHDLMDTEYINTKVKKFQYVEGWTEKVRYQEAYSCGTSKNPRTCYRTKTRYDRHYPYYEAISTTGRTQGISKSKYRELVSKYGEKFVKLHRSNQVSFGDGNKYVVYPTDVVPMSFKHSYTNYVVASKFNVINEQADEETTSKLLKDAKLVNYPKFFVTDFGVLDVDRVVDTTRTIDTKKIYESLSAHTPDLGLLKHVNPIIYITNEDRSIYQYLRAYWKGGKKNDAILVVGIDDSKKVLWSDVITWTNNTDYIVDCQNKFKGMNVESKELVDMFVKLTTDEYIRKPMKEFEYLKENITLSLTAQIVIFMINLVFSVLLARFFIRN